MKVIVYVEGISDKFALETLLSSLIEHKKHQRILIEFIGFKSEEWKIGNNKKYMIAIIPQRAVNIVINDPNAFVIAIPDLYPINCEFPHETADELIKGIEKNFTDALENKSRSYDKRMLRRFKAFCFKYDLEAFLLAAHKELLSYLTPCKPKSWERWKKPVENHNNNNPPKKVVENLFNECRTHYRATTDAPKILSNADYTKIAGRCSQCFKPFVEFLEHL